MEGENPVCSKYDLKQVLRKKVLFFFLSMSRVVWECNPKFGGKFHLKLNISESPIAYKYRKGKMQRTLKRESKELEIVKRETIEVSYLIIF